MRGIQKLGKVCLWLHTKHEREHMTCDDTQSETIFFKNLGHKGTLNIIYIFYINENLTPFQ